MQDHSYYDELHYASSQYPPLLRETKSPPKKLYWRGERPDIPLVAVIGSRRPTPYGEQVTDMLVRDLATAGLGIVSGLAIGIDALAHRAALEAGGYTLAVLGNGIDSIRPATNQKLGEKLLRSGGAIISEHPPGTSAQTFSFPARNRIIAGLSLAVIVTEADAHSGSLITSNFALQYNRRVMAVPGSIFNPRSAGPNNLIRSGAIPVTSAQDILDALDMTTTAKLKKPRAVGPASAEEAAIIKLLNTGITNSDELIRRSNLGAAQFAQVISLMEITGKVKSLGAGIWIKS